MELRPSGKIAVGIIAALGTIGALHLLIFKPRAQEYGEAKQSYDAVVAQYTQQGTTPGINEMYRFRYLSLRHRLEFWRSVENLRIFYPDFYAPGPDGTVDYDEVNYQHRQRVWEIYNRLQELKAQGQAGQTPRLTFLASRQGAWDFRDGLPEDIVQRGIAVEDLMTALRNAEETMRAMDATNPRYAETEAGYNQLLRRLGLDVNYREWLRANLGEFVATFYTMNRIDHVLRNLPADYFRGLDERGRLREMYRLFRLEWPKDWDGGESFLLAQRQAEGLLEIIEAAREEGVEEISFARLLPFRLIYWRDFEEEQAATPTPAGVGGGMMEGMGEDFFMMEGMDMDMDMGGMPTEGGRFGGGGGGPAATPVVEGDLVGSGAPIEIMAVGSNAAVSSLLYRLSNSRNPLELDKLQMRAMGTDGRVQGLAFFNVVSFAMFTLGNTESDIPRMIVETEREMAEYALRPGAQELAQAHGFVVQQPDGSYQLAEPSPTPIPTPEGATPTPGPAAADVDPSMEELF